MVLLHLLLLVSSPFVCNFTYFCLRFCVLWCWVFLVGALHSGWCLFRFVLCLVLSLLYWCTALCNCSVMSCVSLAVLRFVPVSALFGFVSCPCLLCFVFVCVFVLFCIGI